jgi:hypothetical protein
MATETQDAGFVSRWSRRKALVRQGATLPEPAPPAAISGAGPAAPTAGAPQLDAPPQPAATRGEAAAAPAPTLADVAGLTRDSDYSRFVGRSVQPDVRNAALGKLFADPHFNVMDGLDVYIDDYGKPDPLPEGMLRKMLQAHVLGLFDDDPEKPPTPATPALPAPAAPLLAEPAADENPDLQLQPDDDARRPGLAPGAGEDAGRAA